MVARGRPRSFDREQALQSAVDLFWSSGYEGTTLAQLQKAMGGITAPSFYAAFGSKEALFREAVHWYNKAHGAAAIRALAEGPTARASIEGLLRAAVAVVCQQGRPRGCLAVLGAVNSRTGNDAIGAFLRGMRAQRQKVILQRLARGVAEGDLPKGVDLEAVANFYAAVIDGLALQARDGVSRETLETIGRSAMKAWNGLVRRKLPQ